MSTLLSLTRRISSRRRAGGGSFTAGHRAWPGAAVLLLAGGCGVATSAGRPDALESPPDIPADRSPDAPPTDARATPLEDAAQEPPDAAALPPDQARAGDVSAADPWLAGWDRRRRVTVARPHEGEAVDGVPALLVLTPADIDYAQTRPDGSDVRFVAEGAVVPHEIESWNAGGTTRLWVRLPRLTPGAAASLWMYHGNTSAPARPSSDVRATWAPSFAAVWHMSGDAKDATGNAFDGTPVGVSFGEGKIGQAARFSSAERHLIRLARNNALVSGARGVTVSCWLRHEGAVRDNQDIVLGVGTASTSGHLSRVSVAVSPGLGLVGEANPDEGRFEVQTSTAGALANGSWRHVAVVIDVPGRRIELYRDGQRLGNAYQGRWTKQAFPTTASHRITIGAEEDESKSFFNGSIDELRVEREARSPSWIAAQHRASQDGYLVVSPEAR